MCVYVCMVMHGDVMHLITAHGAANIPGAGGGICHSSHSMRHTCGSLAAACHWRHTLAALAMVSRSVHARILANTAAGSSAGGGSGVMLHGGDGRHLSHDHPTAMITQSPHQVVHRHGYAMLFSVEKHPSFRLPWRCLP